MQRTEPINTETLQRRFPETYRSFFGACQQVASASNLFFWTGELSGYYGGLTVSQKLPLRTYVGLEATFDGKVDVQRQYQAYQGDKDTFVAGTLDDGLCSHIATFLTEALSGQKGFKGVRLHLLAEVPLGHSLGANGAIAAAIATLLEPKATLDERFVLARRLLSQTQGGLTSGASAYTALADLQGPLVFFAKDDGFVAKPLDSFPGVQAPLSWPLDFGLIYTGIQSQSSGVIRASEQTIGDLDATSQDLDEVLGAYQKLDFRGTFLGMLNITAGMTVSALVDLFTGGSRNHILERLFNSLNQYHNLLYTIHSFNQPTDLLYSRIHTLASKQVNGMGSGVKISGLGKGGAVLFAMPYGTHRDALLRLVDELRTDSGFDLWLDYASWIDGVGGGPAILEQDVTAGKQSSFVGRDSLALTVVRQGVIQRQVVTAEKFTELSQEVDLVLDLISGKILVGGQPVTSKELPSQKATVQIMADLLRAKKHTLNNDQLPAAYGSSRYDLQGKVMLPLVKQVKERTGRELLLSVKGDMYDNYSLTLDPATLNVAIVERKG